MRTLVSAALVLAAVVLVGCGEKVDPALVQNPSQEQVDAAKARRDEVFAIYDRAGGDWNKMTPQDRQRMVELSNGDIGMAQRGWEALGSLPRN